jgi:thioredoxin 1
MVRIIDFYADWCVPCKQYDVILPEVTQELGIELEKVNVEYNEDMVKEYGIKGLPTLVIMDGEERIAQIEGASSKDKLKERLNNILADRLRGPSPIPKWEDPPKHKFIR